MKAKIYNNVVRGGAAVHAVRTQQEATFGVTTKKLKKSGEVFVFLFPKIWTIDNSGKRFIIANFEEKIITY